MNIGALSSSDTMYNFVKLVDAARQRNISAFDVACDENPARAKQKQCRPGFGVSAGIYKKQTCRR